MDNSSEQVCGFLAGKGLEPLTAALMAAGRAVVGPVVRDGAVVFSRVASAAAFANAVLDEQVPGGYRLVPDPEGRVFGWATGPQALKPLVFEPEEVLWAATRDAAGHLAFERRPPEVAEIAVIGARACDLAALALLDRHSLDGPHADTAYAARRRALFIVAVNCARSAATCFCASTGDGPHAEHGYDLVLTEFEDGFLVASGSAGGAAVMQALDLAPVTRAHLQARTRQAQKAAAEQVRALPGRNLRTVLQESLEHPRWSEVAERCLACGNCTSVCPTCFCHAEADSMSSGAQGSEHRREWDSCFTSRHGHMFGYQVRPQTRHRYRQWLTHKLGTWHDQYGRSGCVGCGRCVTWCPVGIDITEEAAALCAPAAP